MLVCKSIIINKKNYKNNNLNLVILTKELGLIKTVAYGATSLSKRFKGCIDLFKILELELSVEKKHKCTYYVVSNKHKTINSFKNICSDLNKYYLANFILELASIVIHENEIFSKNNKNYFDIIFNTLDYIDKENFNYKEFALKFCLKFFKETGFIAENYKLKASKDLKTFIYEIIEKCPKSIKYL